MKKIKIIGLTGQSGAGKTTVSTYLQSKGFIVIDADKVSREVLKICECKEKIAKFFGKEVFLKNGNIDRKKLAKKAFSSPENVKLLNEITHPEILKRIKLLLKEYELAQKTVILDVPLLFETKLYEFCDVVVAVIADEKLRLKRIVSRDKIDLKAARLRLNAQNKDTFYKSKADFIIYNNSSKEDLFTKVDEILEKVLLK